MLRRTKIVATLGPASDDPSVLQRLVEAGVNVVRINFSHGHSEEHLQRIALVREIMTKFGHCVGIIADLQGPKIRIARFQKGKVNLVKGAQFILDTTLAPNAGTDVCVGLDYKNLPKDVRPGDVLLLDDGRVVLDVKKVEDVRIICQVSVGGELSNNKGINRLGGGLSTPALTDKDRKDLIAAVNAGVDYIAISFPRDASDIHEARALIRQNDPNSDIGIIAKIERSEAVKNIDQILKVSDGVMVARGDLAVEIGDAEVPGVQKKIIQKARALIKPVIVATQMMESMIHSNVPTRAEVSDVANAVLDNTDAVMLSAETAVGEHVVTVIETVSRVCIAAEKELENKGNNIPDKQLNRIDEAIALATVYTANHLDIKAIITLTESGITPLMMSRIRTDIPIFGLSHVRRTLGKMTLYRDVYPTYFDITQVPFEEVNIASVGVLQHKGYVSEDDLIILTKGDKIGTYGGTNVMKIIKVGDVA